MIPAILSASLPLSPKQPQAIRLPFRLHFGRMFGQGVGPCLKTFHDTGGLGPSLCCPLCLAPTEFISHCFLCTGIYDVTANISFVLRWRISQSSCPYGVKQTANMDRLWLGSWGWVDIMVAVRELHLRKKKKKKQGWRHHFFFFFCDSFCNYILKKLQSYLLSLPPSPSPPSTSPLLRKHHIKMKTSTFPGSVMYWIIPSDEKDI